MSCLVHKLKGRVANSNIRITLIHTSAKSLSYLDHLRETKKKITFYTDMKVWSVFPLIIQ